MKPLNFQLRLALGDLTPPLVAKVRFATSKLTLALTCVAWSVALSVKFLYPGAMKAPLLGALRTADIEPAASPVTDANICGPSAKIVFPAPNPVPLTVTAVPDT